MNQQTKNDIYDTMDLLDKLYALPFLKDKDRFNEIQNMIMSVLEKSRESEQEGVTLSGENDLCSIEGLYGLVEMMEKKRKKEQLSAFAREMDIEVDEKKYTLAAMRGLILLELIKKNGGSASGAHSMKMSKSKKNDQSKKDFMDMWIDFYKKNRERK